jgi:RNA polymerase sigma-70 factor (ECF subfamily)
MAEDLTSKTFLAALTALEVNPSLKANSAWLVGIARHKLVDHWRTEERSVRRQQLLLGQNEPTNDPWEVELDALRARDALKELGSHHRAALTLRYIDGLPVREVADQLVRSRTATETLLMRAKAAFRRIYERKEGTEDD